jgi:dihydroflavonol-4-reductase
MILVTGGTGMIGAHLLYKLAKKESKIRAVKRKSSDLSVVKQIFSYLEKNYESLFDAIEWVEADILDHNSMLMVMEGVDFVYHSAAMVSFNPADRDKMLHVNIKGTQNVVNAALEKGVKKMCHVSSTAALGDSVNGEPLTEETFRNPKREHSGYSVSKYLSELEVWRGITEGLNAVIVNPSVVLGTGNWNAGSPSIFSTIQKGMSFYSKGIMGYVDVLDVVNIMVQLMESEISGERYLVSAENLSFKDFFTMVAHELNAKIPKVKANSVLLEIAWRLELLKSKITGSAPRVTKETIRVAQKQSTLSSEKLLQAIDFKYTPIKQCVARIGNNFKNSKSA